MNAVLVSMVLCAVGVFGYEFICPDRSHRRIYSKAACLNPKDFTCLKDALVGTYNQSCYICRPVASGFKYVYRPGYDREPCASSRYQPFIFYRTQQTDCFYLKSGCIDEGQILYSHGSNTSDVKCTCDERNGFTFVTQPRNKTLCIPSEEDCSCYRKTESVVRNKDHFITSHPNLATSIKNTFIGLPLVSQMKDDKEVSLMASRIKDVKETKSSIRTNGLKVVATGLFIIIVLGLGVICLYCAWIQSMDGDKEILVGEAGIEMSEVGTVNMIKNCSICQFHNKKGAPVVWCPLCLECLCSSCEQQHQAMRLSREHITIPYESYCKLPPFILNVDIDCQNHNEKYQYFCRSHDVPCCVKCLSTTHTKCKDTPVIDNVIGNVKSSAGFEDIWKDLMTINEAYKVAIDFGENNLQEIETKKNEFAKRVKERTDPMIDQLKTIKSQTLAVLESVVTETSNKIKNTNETLRSKETNLKSIINHKTSIQSHASDLQTFLGIKHIENEVKESKKIFQQMCKDGSLSICQIVMEENGTIEDAIVGAKTLCDFTVLTEKTTISQDSSMNQPNTAQMMVSKKCSPLLNPTQQFQLGEGRYQGCCTLPNGLMAFSDRSNNEIILTKSDGSINSRVKFAHGVIDVCVIDENHIAASIYEEHTISIVNVEDIKIFRRLKTKSKVSGISLYNGYIYFCVPQRGIMKINIATEKRERVHDDKSVGWLSRIDIDSKRLCYTCHRQNSVTLLDLDSDYKVIFSYKDKDVLDGPIGILFDPHQNMLVCNNIKNNLLFISRDGGKVETLVTEADGLNDPYAIHYCAETKAIVVSGARRAWKYSVY